MQLSHRKRAKNLERKYSKPWSRWPGVHPKDGRKLVQGRFRRQNHNEERLVLRELDFYKTELI